MISSVVARFTAQADVDRTIDAIVTRDGFEVGELIDGRLLPITIEASNNEDTEIATRWIQELPGVAQVDVTFVSWESE